MNFNLKFINKYKLICLKILILILYKMITNFDYEFVIHNNEL